MVEDFLVARDVSYRYAVRRGVEPVEVLRRFSVSLTQGEFFCLLGPSGCGKTTVLNLMAGFLEPADGMLTLAGRPIAEEEAALLFIVFQQGDLIRSHQPDPKRAAKNDRSHRRCGSSPPWFLCPRNAPTPCRR